MSMKRTIIFFIMLIAFLSKEVYAGDYKWDLINALVRNDMTTIESILKSNISTMSVTDKKLVMNFTINYSSGENTLRVLTLLSNYNIRPDSFDLYTALERNRQNGAIQFILRSGAAANGEILLLSMERQRLDLAKYFIESGVDVNYQYPLTKNYADGMTPLLYASKWGSFELVKLLVEKGANINTRSANGETALYIAQKNSSDEICNYLLEHGATELWSNIVPQTVGAQGGQIVNFQTGSYRLSGSNRYMVFSGAANSGTVNYLDGVNSRSTNGVFRIAGNSLTVVLNGIQSVYRLNTSESYSGNGEVWVKLGN